MCCTWFLYGYLPFGGEQGLFFFNWKQLGAVAKNNAMRAVWFNQNSYGLKNYNELKDNKKVLAGHAGI